MSARHTGRRLGRGGGGACAAALRAVSVAKTRGVAVPACTVQAGAASAAARGRATSRATAA
ncbi:hypothetical protein WS67_10520 [Burkholderia singularis]|uniref:Uncharacterized protein n=1 Tax=Burkholderia singularis TaxID=1503053 RepID=A0A103E428_9BURK|nr:hypothetical protein WS67_10520 [Burkholderia singularis]